MPSAPLIPCHPSPAAASGRPPQYPPWRLLRGWGGRQVRLVGLAHEKTQHLGANGGQVNQVQLAHIVRGQGGGGDARQHGDQRGHVQQQAHLPADARNVSLVIFHPITSHNAYYVKCGQGRTWLVHPESSKTRDRPLGQVHPVG